MSITASNMETKSFLVHLFEIAILSNMIALLFLSFHGPGLDSTNKHTASTNFLKLSGSSKVPNLCNMGLKLEKICGGWGNAT